MFIQYCTTPLFVCVFDHMQKKLILHIPAPLPQYPLLWSCSDPSRKALDHIYELLGIRKHKGCPKNTCQQKQKRKINELRYRMRLINAFLVIL